MLQLYLSHSYIKLPIVLDVLPVKFEYPPEKFVLYMDDA